LILPSKQYAYCSDAIKHVEFNEDLKRLFGNYQKDFAIWKELAEIFIVLCDFTFKMEVWPTFKQV